MAEKYYLVEERTMFGKATYSKVAGTPKTKSVNGGTRRITRKQEISHDQWLKAPIDDLVASYWPKEKSNAN